MSDFTFVIPGNRDDLLKTKIDDEYKVKSVSILKSIPAELKNCRSSLQDEGAEFIIDAFDVYFSVLHHGDSVGMDLLYRAYEDLHKAAVQLNKSLGFLLEDKDSLNDDLKLKYLNIIKMIIYLYTQTVIEIEKRHAAKREQQVAPVRKGKKVSKDTEEFLINKQQVLLILNNIIQRDISLFWESQVIEENFISLISGICYEFLQNPYIAKEQEELTGIFNIFGCLLKNYNHGTTFVVRITQLIKLYEHVVQCVPKGIQQLVQDFNHKGLLHELIEEITEWQTEENYQDAQGARHCSLVLSSLASLMPSLMAPEVLSLNHYLYCEPPNLRISVIAVMTEVILNVLTNKELDDEQKKFKDELLDIILEHTEDNAVLVRSKVFAQFSRLQIEMALPVDFQLQVLDKAVLHLMDKGILARKMAANCVTTFLNHNFFSADLSLSKMTDVLESKKKQLLALKELGEPRVDELMELQKQWDKIVNPLEKTVKKLLKLEDENEENESPKKLPIDQIESVVRVYLQSNQYKEAFQVLKQVIKDHDFIKDFKEASNMQGLDFYMNIFYTIHFNVAKIAKEIGKRPSVGGHSEETFNKLNQLSTEVDTLTKIVTFLKLIDNAIDTMIELLDTTSVHDMHEAIEFIVAAYKFNIDRSMEGILAMLKLMKRTEQERKDAIINAFKNVYLSSDDKNIQDHSMTIVQRLLRLVTTLPVINLDDLQEIISDWVAKGTLDNNVIDILWQIVYQRVKETEDNEIAAIMLLKMAAYGRKTIVSRNINLVISVATGDRGKNNMQFLGACMEFLSVAQERINIESDEPAFKIALEEECLKDLVNILASKFFEPVPFYSRALYGSLEFAYKLSGKPEAFAEQLLRHVIPEKLYKMQENNPDIEVPTFVLIRLCQMLGYIALKELEYMDETVYKELKRRDNVRDARKKKEKSFVKKSAKKNTRKSKSASEASNMSVTEESLMEGAQAEDMDAEYILNILEKDIVTGSGYLGIVSGIVEKICERPDIFIDVDLQFAAVTALSRYMLVSSVYCNKHKRLFFTIFEKTEHPSIKACILIHVSDLLTRFPNVIEPWLDRLFQSLKDPLPETRQTTFFTLSNLILRDMIRAHKHVPQMATCLIDEDPRIRAMAKTFFLKLSHKENNLYNALPDIFTYFIEENVGDDESIQKTMSTLFEMAENAKHIENIVTRFCTKLKLTEDTRQHRLITFCLTLIKYNEKALQKLIEEFPIYKHLMHDEEVYANFRTIIQNCTKQVVGKQDLKPLATELENQIKNVFELNGDQAAMPPPPLPKSTKKKTKNTKTPSKRTRRKKKVASSDSDEDNSD